MKLVYRIQKFKMNKLAKTLTLFSFLFPRRGSVTLPLLHHAKLPAQDARAALHPETRRENPFTGGPARHHAHPCRWGFQVHHHLPCVLTGWDRCQC